jgi:signal transduction histidine kinase
MNTQWDVISSEGFQFMGKMNASISHEIKNVLAIINENAGLLEDFTIMAEKGMPTNPERLKTVVGKIQSQVQRADKIVKNMNTFAHSVDETRGSVELGGLLSLMAVLTERLAAMKELMISAAPPQNPIAIITNPFLLETMVWFCLDFAMGIAGSGKKLHLTVYADDQWATIMISGLENIPGIPSPDIFPGSRENALLQALGGRAVFDESGGKIVLSLPRETEAQNF